MKYYRKIVGNSTYLSPVDPDDYELSAKWINDLDVANGLGYYYKLSSSSKEKKDLTDSAMNDYLFGIVSKESDTLLGFCSFVNMNNIHQRAEIFIFIGEKNMRGKGYGKDALLQLLEYGFGTLNLNNIMVRVFPFNHIAINLYKEVGFKQIGIRRNAFYKDYTYIDEIYMDIIKKDFIS